MSEGTKGLELLREPFPENLIGKLPKPTKQQTDEVKKEFRKGIRCKICGGWHHPNVVHLDYVGHAAATERLLNADIHWKWEPLALDDFGLPKFDSIGGLWIKLTVCGQTRLGYGHPDNKKGGNAIKEAIGDAIRNAGMRFGLALDLWHKGDLHDIVNIDNDEAGDHHHINPITGPPINSTNWTDRLDKKGIKDVASLEKWYLENKAEIGKMDEVEVTKVNRYVGQMKDIIAGEQTKESTNEQIECPHIPGSLMPKEDCQTCQELKECPAHNVKEES